MLPRTGPRTAGFTMVELLLAIMIMTVVLVAAVPSLMNSRRLTRESQDTHLAVLRLNALLDQILIEEVADLVDVNGPYPLDSVLVYNEGAALPDEVITITSPNYDAGDPTPAVLELELQMTWTSSRRTRTMTLATARR